MATTLPMPLTRTTGHRTAGARHHRTSRMVVFVLVAVAALLTASTAAAYIVVLKDGTQIITKDKYELDGERVILTMRNGNTTFYDASDVDFERTEELNHGKNAGQATFIEEKLLEIERDDEEAQIDTQLSDVVGGKGLSLPEPKKRKPKVTGEAELPKTAAGYVDFVRVEKLPPQDAEVAAEIESYLEGQGHTLSIYHGVSEEAPLVEIRANTESEVFKGIRDSASALVQLTQRFPARVEGFDVLFLTDKDVRGGQFSMTLEQAQLITSGRLEPQVYFLRYVEF